MSSRIKYSASHINKNITDKMHYCHVSCFKHLIMWFYYLPHNFYLYKGRKNNIILVIKLLVSQVDWIIWIKSFCFFYFLWWYMMWALRRCTLKARTKIMSWTNDGVGQVQLDNNLFSGPCRLLAVPDRSNEDFSCVNRSDRPWCVDGNFTTPTAPSHYVFWDFSMGMNMNEVWLDLNINAF